MDKQRNVVMQNASDTLYNYILSLQKKLTNFGEKLRIKGSLIKTILIV